MSKFSQSLVYLKRIWKVVVDITLKDQPTVLSRLKKSFYILFKLNSKTWIGVAVVLSIVISVNVPTIIDSSSNHSDSLAFVGSSLPSSGEYYVNVIDHESTVHITDKFEPFHIVQALGYQLDADDRVYWDGFTVAEDNTEIRNIRISRQHDYILKINNIEMNHQSTHRQVSEILGSAGYDLEQILYVNPSLNQIVSEGQIITMFYGDDNRKLVTELSTQVVNGMLQEIESVYYIVLDHESQAVISKILITQEMIGETNLVKRYLSANYYSEIPEVYEGWLTKADIPESDWEYANFIIFNESTWNPTAWNKQGSSAYGLCQALPYYKMSSAGSDYMTNPITQLKWCHSYALDRYGSWQKAFEFWQINKWW